MRVNWIYWFVLSRKILGDSPRRKEAQQLHRGPAPQSNVDCAPICTTEQSGEMRLELPGWWWTSNAGQSLAPEEKRRSMGLAVGVSQKMRQKLSRVWIQQSLREMLMSDASAVGPVETTTTHTHSHAGPFGNNYDLLWWQTERERNLCMQLCKKTHIYFPLPPTPVQWGEVLGRNLRNGILSMPWRAQD